MRDFEVRNFYAYKGSNQYLNRQALIFNIYLDPHCHKIDYYRARVLEKFPKINEHNPQYLTELFCETLIQVLKMDIDLHVNNYDIRLDNDEYVIAVEYLDEQVTEDAVYFVSEYFQALNENKSFDFDTKFQQLQNKFHRSLLGGPTIYSLIEAGLNRDIPILYLEEENQFQWGYGKKQLRGRSTIFHTDGIKDTEFTTYKDMAKEFLLMCGFPTPRGRNCFREDEIIRAIEELNPPLVVKPVSGHKGQGVITNIQSVEQAKRAFRNIVDAAKKQGTSFNGAIVEEQIYGTDHRLLAVRGKFVAALERIPGYVDGNGKDTIEKLIDVENSTLARKDNARSPLPKLKIDSDMLDYLKEQEKSLKTVPAKDERVYLRKVANISAGGVSINVTDKIHPKNIKLVEDIAKFFKVTCFAIDVLAKDISKPWTDGGFGIIEVNAGPGVFMHLVPARGESIDVPGKILESYFPKPGNERIPIITGNKLSLNFCTRLFHCLQQLKPDIEFGSLTSEGIYFNNEYFFNNRAHDQNIKIMLRNPKLEFAVINHTSDEIFDYGMVHQGADIVILEDPHSAEKKLSRDLLPGGYLFTITQDILHVSQNGEEKSQHKIETPENKESVLIGAIELMLKELLEKYE